MSHCLTAIYYTVYTVLTLDYEVREVYCQLAKIAFLYVEQAGMVGEGECTVHCTGWFPQNGATLIYAIEQSIPHCWSSPVYINRLHTAQPTASQ
jgi:hypothetical protein